MNYNNELAIATSYNDMMLDELERIGVITKEQSIDLKLSRDNHKTFNHDLLVYKKGRVKITGLYAYFAYTDTEQVLLMTRRDFLDGLIRTHNIHK